MVPGVLGGILMKNSHLPPDKRQGRRKAPSPSSWRRAFPLLAFLLIFLLFALLRPSFAPFFQEPAEGREESAPQEKSQEKETFEEGLLADPLPKAELQEKRELRLFAVGDIMHHLEQAQRVDRGLSAAQDEFSLIKPFFSQADLLIGNFESTVHPEKPFSGYPLFNTPEAIFPALKDAGFQVLTTVNNHSLDTGISGVESTLAGIRKAGMVPVGTHLPGKKRTALVKVKGLQIGICAYSYGFNGLEKAQSPETLDQYVNTLDPASIQKDIEDLRAQGADLILVYPHWGVEYSSAPSPEQRDLARKMIDWGADAVIGNHPHVIQPCEWIEASDGRKGFVLYACGNFISMQRYGQFSDFREEQSVLVEIKVEKLGEGPVEWREVRVHPLWVRESRDQEGLLYQPLLVEEYRTGGPRAEELKENERERVDRAYREIQKQVESLENESNPLGIFYGNEKEGQGESSWSERPSSESE